MILFNNTLWNKYSVEYISLEGKEIILISNTPSAMKRKTNLYDEEIYDTCEDAQKRFDELTALLVKDLKHG